MTTRALIDSEIQGLSRALATYDQAIRDFGPVRPFINIRETTAASSCRCTGSRAAGCRTGHFTG